MPLRTGGLAACHQLRDRLDDGKYGQAGWEACDRLLDTIEDRKGWPEPGN